MILYKLTGYNQTTGIYTNPVSGQVENLPNVAFTIADSTPDNYDSFDEPQHWAKYGSSLINSFFGLKEYLSLRWEIYTRIELICGSDYSNWNTLSSEQQRIALIWCNVRIINTQGIIFYITKCGNQDIANNYLGTFLGNSYAARKLRYYTAFTIFGYTYLGKTQGLKAEGYARHDFLDTTYLDRGVVFKEDDGIDGLGDWILGINGYSTTGLKPRIIAGEFTLGGGIDVDTFCNSLIGIIDDGLF